MDQVKVVDNFISDEDCSYIVDIYNNYMDKGLFKKSSDNRYVMTKVQIPEIVDFVQKHCNKVTEIYNKKYYVRDILMSIYSDNGYIEPHLDYDYEELMDSLGMVMYFNDEFEGGEIYIPLLNFEYKPKKGSAILFPCNLPGYEHGVKGLKSGTRYTMPVELTPKKELEYVVYN